MVHISNQMRVTWGEEVPRGIVKNFHRHCELPAVCDSVNGVDGIISLGRSTRCQSQKNEGAVYSDICFQDIHFPNIGRLGRGERIRYLAHVKPHA